MPNTKKAVTPKVVKKAVKSMQVTTEKKVATTVKKASSNGVDVYSLAGTKSTTILELPEEIFGAKVNKDLLSQAMRVYLNNQKAHFAHTKTRGEVVGSTRKIIKQKGTGGARHGSKRAPIFVGGGIALGPKSRKVELELPKKMKKAALIAALSQKALEKSIVGLTGLDQATGKTKEMVNLFKKLNKKSSILIIADQRMDKVMRSLRNIPKVSFSETDQLNAFEIIRHQSIILTREAVEKLTEKLTRSSKDGSKKEAK